LTNWIIKTDAGKGLKLKGKPLRVVESYCKFQTYCDIGWGTFSWWSNALVELMAVLYILEKVGVLIEGNIIFFALACAFVFFFLFGLGLKRVGFYDQSEFTEANIDPVQKELLEAARIIKDKLGE